MKFTKFIPAVAAAAALALPATASAWQDTPICVKHNYGTRTAPHTYVVTSTDASCSTVRQVMHRAKRGIAKGYVYQRATHGWSFVSAVIDPLTPNRVTETFVRNGVTMTVVGQYVN